MHRAVAGTLKTPVTNCDVTNAFRSCQRCHDRFNSILISISIYQVVHPTSPGYSEHRQSCNRLNEGDSLTRRERPPLGALPRTKSLIANLTLYRIYLFLEALLTTTLHILRMLYPKRLLQQRRTSLYNARKLLAKRSSHRSSARLRTSFFPEVTRYRTWILRSELQQASQDLNGCRCSAA